MIEPSEAALPPIPMHRRFLKRVGDRLRRTVSTTNLAAALRVTMPLRRGNLVMFHVGRSGSTVLGGLLNQHPAVYWDGELFEGYYGAAADQMRERGIPTSFRWNSSRYYPDDMFGFLRSRMPLAGFRSYYGFEAKFFHIALNHCTLPQFIDHLENCGFSHFLILERRNLLRKIASSAVAHQRLEFHHTTEKKATLTRVHIDPDRLEIDSDSKPMLAYLDDWNRRFAELRELLSRRKALWLTYESDIGPDPLIAYRRCCDFLGVPPYQTRVQLGRTNPFPLQEIIANWPDVVAALSGTDYEWMLYDSSN